MGFFGYLKKGIQINMLKADAIEEVASDEGAFVPGLVILLLPPLLVGLLMYFKLRGLFTDMSTEGGVDPQIAMVLSMFGDTVKGLSISFVFLFPFLTLCSEIFSVGIFHLFAKLLKGEGSYMDYFQTICVASIISWVSATISMIPIVNLLNLLISLWFLVVIVVITAKVHNFGYGKAIAAVLLPLIILSILMFAVLMMILVPLMMQAGGGVQPM